MPTTRQLLESILGGNSPTPAEIADVFGAMFRGEVTDPEMAAVLVALRMRGETGATLAAAAKVMRTNAKSLLVPPGIRPLADNCGTGGDGGGTFNISTSAAFTAAACGVRIAKHGNRSVSSKCGSADLMFAAGFPTGLPTESLTTLLAESGFTFFFAPDFHPLVKNVMPVRKALGVRTIFNFLGPLANPIAPDTQLIGVGAVEYVRPMAEAASILGIQNALVVHSRDGLDEISPAAPTDCVRVTKGKLEDITIDPHALGIRANLSGLAGGDATLNLGLLQTLLSGTSGAIQDAVALNAGALLWLAGRAPSIADGLSAARAALLSGTVRRWFDKMIARAQELTNSQRGASHHG